MKRFFDLQLFNDTVSLDTLKEQGFTDEELKMVMEQQPESTPEPQQEPQQEPTTEPTVEPEPTPEPTPEPPAPDSDKVSKHVPYDRFKEVNERNKVLMAELEALRAAQQQAAPQQPQPQQAPQQQQSDVYSQIKNYAKQEAVKKLGIEGNPQDLMFTDTEKYEEYLTERAKIEYQETYKYQEQQKVYQDNVSFVRELQSIPDFPTVYQYAMQELDEMPRKQARVIDEAYSRIDAGRGTSKDFEVIRNFANQCREKMNGVASQPPITQAAISTPPVQQANPLDKAAGLPRANNLSGAKTAAMSWSQVEQLIVEGKIDQIPKDMLKQIPTLEKF